MESRNPPRRAQRRGVAAVRILDACLVDPRRTRAGARSDALLRALMGGPVGRVVSASPPVRRTRRPRRVHVRIPALPGRQLRKNARGLRSLERRAKAGIALSRLRCRCARGDRHAAHIHLRRHACHAMNAAVRAAIDADPAAPVPTATSPGCSNPGQGRCSMSTHSSISEHPGLVGRRSALLSPRLLGNGSCFRSGCNGSRKVDGSRLA